MTESKDQRTGWLKELKVGDKVFVDSSKGVLGRVKRLATVEKITPTGRLNVDGEQFPPSGEKYENYRSTKLVQATEKAIMEFALEKQKSALIRKITDKVNDGVLAEMSFLDLEAIKMTIDKYKK